MPAGQNFRFIRVKTGDEAAADRVSRFYDLQKSEHLFPRKVDELAQIAEEGALFAVEHRDAVIAACYVKWDSEKDLVREFGGICIDGRYRDQRIASIFSRLAIAQGLVNAPELKVLKANVHWENDAPNLLLGRLGFVLTDEVARIEPKDVRAPMKPTVEDGAVTGRVWSFAFSACSTIAERLRGWDLKVGDSRAFIDFGEHSGKSREILVDLAAEMDLMARERSAS